MQSTGTWIRAPELTDRRPMAHHRALVPPLVRAVVMRPEGSGWAIARWSRREKGRMPMRRAFLAPRFAPVVAGATVLWLALGLSQAALGNVSLVKVSSDPYTNTSSFHKTQVEPDTYSFGNTIVATFQSGRFTNGGASNVGWSTSTDGGSTWKKG